jgi:delta24(24(1))-sterol reductase
MTVAILSGYINSVIVYVQALVRGRTHRMTGSTVYDFFVGAELNPRIGILDFKMFYEVRIPWFILFLITASVAARQYELYGYVSAEVIFLAGAHWLYANACAKGEHLIITSW